MKRIASKSEITANHDSANHADRRAQFSALLLLVLAAALFLTLPSRIPVRYKGHLSGQVTTGIDPNRADWFELAQLPGIGETLSRRIIAFRESQSSPVGGPVFHDASDLDRVSGIGAGIIRRIAPFVRFPSPEIASAVDKHMTGG